MTQNLSVLRIEPGAEVMCAGSVFIVTRVLDLDTVLAKSVETGNLTAISIKEVGPVENGASTDPTSTNKLQDLEDVSLEHWAEAKRRYELIKPLLSPAERGKALGRQIAQQNGVGLATLYRWRRDFLNSGKLSSLLPPKPDGGRGKARLENEEIEAIIADTIRDFHMTDAHPSISATHRKLRSVASWRICQFPTIRPFEGGLSGSPGAA